MIVGFVVIFFGSVFLFRSKSYEAPVERSQATGVERTEQIDAAPTVLHPDATILLLSTKKPAGTATRLLQNNVLNVSLRATLPEIDRESQFYQLWLVRPVPYDYFSAGELVTNEMGAFVLNWVSESTKDYSGYTDLVITLQVRGGSSDPQTHIAEGEFGK